MYFVSALVGHGTSSAPSASGAPIECTQGMNVAVVAEDVERLGAHPGHDPHVDHDVGRVGQLHADLGLVRAQRAHRERARRTSCGRRIAAAEELVHLGAHLGRRAPVVRRAGVLLALGADEGAVLDAGDVAGVRPGQVAVGALGLRELGEGARRRRAPGPAGRTPRPSRRTSGPRRAASAGRSRRPRRAASRWRSARTRRWPRFGAPAAFEKWQRGRPLQHGRPEVVEEGYPGYRPDPVTRD